MSPVETLLLDVDARHEPNLGMFAGKPMILGCSCMSVRDYRRAGHHGGFLGHRAHVAAEQAKALREWLTSDETFLVAREGIINRTIPPYVGFGAARADARAVLAALANLIGGAR